MLLNEQTKQCLKTMTFSDGKVYLLTGGKGSGRMTYVRQAAAVFFRTAEKHLQDHPDYFELRTEKTLGINDLLQLREFTEYLPACASCKVAVLDAPSLTDEAQASLLKLLEDGATQVMFILIVNSKLLDTIKSRSREIPFLPVEAEKMAALDGDPVARAMAYGKPGMFHLFNQPAWETFIRTCENAADAVVSVNRVAIMQSLHLVKEKDKNAFFECYGRQCVALWLRYLSDRIATAITSTDQIRRDKLLNIEAKVCCGRQSIECEGHYSKNDFFNLICSICECC